MVPEVVEGGGIARLEVMCLIPLRDRDINAWIPKPETRRGGCAEQSLGAWTAKPTARHSLLSFCA